MAGVRIGGSAIIPQGVVPFVLYTHETGGSPDAGISIWYVTETPGQSLIQIAASTLDQLSSDDLADPRASPDGTMIVWSLVSSATASEVLGAAVDGSWGPFAAIGTPQPSILFTSVQPFWRPDSSGIVYRLLDDSPSEGYIRSCDIDPDTGISSNDTLLRTINRSTVGTPLFPTYNFDGTKIVYGVTKALFSTPDEIWVMDADGSNNTLLVSDAGGTIENGRAFSLAHTSDHVVYSQQLTSTTIDIRKIALDGTGDTSLFVGDTTAGAAYGVTRYCIATDDSVVFYFNRENPGVDPQWTLYAIDMAGGGGSILNAAYTSYGFNNDTLAFVFGDRVYWANGPDEDTTDIVSCLFDGSALRTEFSCTSPPPPFDAIAWIGGFAGTNNQP